MTPLIDGEAGCLGELDPRAHADADDDDFGGERGAVSSA